MKQETIERLSQTDEGRAIIEAVEHAGGRGAFMAATGLTSFDMNNFYRRGRFSQYAAHVVARTPYFKKAGWTKEKCLPNLKPFQWKTWADLSARMDRKNGA